jgi:Arg-Lys translocation region protein phosphatase
MIQYFEKLSFRYKVTILVFLVSFIFYMAFILVEDLLILAPIFKNSQGFEHSRRGIRLLFGLCFSILIATITAFAFNMFYSSLNHLISILQNWTNDDHEDHAILISSNDELGNLTRSLQLTIFQEKEKAKKESYEQYTKDLKKQVKNIHSTYSEIHLKKIKNLDISLFPKSPINPNLDYFNLIPTKQGCFGLMAGFDTAGIMENSYKSRLHGILTFIESASKNSTFQIRDVINTLELNPVPRLNCILFDLHSDTGELNYTSWKQSSGFIIGEQGIRELEKGNSLYVPIGGESLDLLSEVYRSELQEGETLVILSDLILSNKKILSSSFWMAFEREISERKYLTSNTRETTISIAKWCARKYGKISLEQLGILAIRRPFR